MLNLAIKFRFEGSVQSDGMYPARIMYLEIDAIRNDHEKQRDAHKRASNNDLNWGYCDMLGLTQCDGILHSDECSTDTKLWGVECAHVQAKFAISRLARLEKLDDLLTCITSPEKADLYDTLSEGMAQESCIYSLKGADRGGFFDPSKRHGRVQAFPDNDRKVNTSDNFRALRVEFGWRWSEIRRDLPVAASILCAVVFAVWTCTLIVGVVTGDWQTGLALGSLLLTSAVLLLCGKL